MGGSRWFDLQLRSLEESTVVPEAFIWPVLGSTRALTLICALELERQKDVVKLGEWPFEIGLSVGKAATSNRMGSKEDKDQETARAKTIAYTLVKLRNLDHTALTYMDEVRHAVVAQNVLKHPLKPALVDVPYGKAPQFLEPAVPFKK